MCESLRLTLPAPQPQPVEPAAPRTPPAATAAPTDGEPQEVQKATPLHLQLEGWGTEYACNARLTANRQQATCQPCQAFCPAEANPLCLPGRGGLLFATFELQAAGLLRHGLGFRV